MLTLDVPRGSRAAPFNRTLQALDEHPHPPPHQRRASFSHAQTTHQCQQQHAHRRSSFGPGDRIDMIDSAATPRRKSSLRLRGSHRRSSRNNNRLPKVETRDITALLSVQISVEGFEYNSSTMEHPEFQVATRIEFQCKQYGSKRLESSWTLPRTFQAFQGLDVQLRRTARFEQIMRNISPPRPHRRRTFFHMDRSASFLTRRCAELTEYLTIIMSHPEMRLTRFLDPHTSLVLRYFCNFDVGFGDRVRVLANQYDDCKLCLDDVSRDRVSDRFSDLELATMQLSLTHDRPSSNQQQELTQRALRLSFASGSRRSMISDAPSKAESVADEMEANLLDDRGRNIVMCQRINCGCQKLSFRVTEGTMTRILRLRGFRPTFRPVDVEGPTALHCVLFRLQQYNNLDSKLYNILRGYSASKAPTESSCTESEGDEDQADSMQLAGGVELLREALANYALLYVNVLEPHFHMSVVELTRKIHAFKSRKQQRVGAVELVLLCSMLDLTIVLITNDHEGTVQEIFPLPGLKPIRRGGRILITLGYILPTMVCVNGLYLLADSNKPQDAPVFEPTMWQGLEEMDRCLITLVEQNVLHSELRRVEDYDYDPDFAEVLRREILQAVWMNIDQHPTVFKDFERQALQYGRSRTTASQYFAYLELVFGLDGAAYLVDFLLHILPEVNLRKQLLRARWRGVHRLLTKRVAAVASST